jgi:hypothetical protein
MKGHTEVERIRTNNNRHLQRTQTSIPWTVFTSIPLPNTSTALGLYYHQVR